MGLDDVSTFLIMILITIICPSISNGVFESTLEPTHEPTLEPTTTSSNNIPPTLYAENEIAPTTTTSSMALTNPIQTNKTDTNRNHIIKLIEDNILVLTVCILGLLLSISCIIIIIMISKRRNTIKSMQPNLKYQVKAHTIAPEHCQDVKEDINDIEVESNIEKYIDLRKFQKSVNIYNTTPMGDKKDKMEIEEEGSINAMNKKVIFEGINGRNDVLKDMYSVISRENTERMDQNAVLSPIAANIYIASDIEEGSVISRGNTDDINGDGLSDKQIQYVNGVGSELVLYEESKRNIYATDNEQSDVELIEHGNTSNGILRSNNGEYKWIKDALRECDDMEWNKYLENFKRHKITEQRLKHLPNDNEDLWKEVLPEIGVRYQFKALWNERKLKLINL